MTMLSDATFTILCMEMTTGVRIADQSYPFNAGEYSKHVRTIDGRQCEFWWVHVPSMLAGSVIPLGRPNHDGTVLIEVIEEEDGSITVNDVIEWKGWRGTIHRGEWRS